jgi:hypothetical protein
MGRSMVHIRLGVAEILIKWCNVIHWEVHHEMMVRFFSGDEREHFVQRLYKVGQIRSD